MKKSVVVWSLLVLLQGLQELKAQVDYDIVYVRQVRFGDMVNTTWPEIFHPGRMDAGADLMLLHPDGSEEILVDCETCGVTDPVVSFDAQWVYYSYFYDLSQGSLNTQRGDLPHQGADIYRIHLNSRVIEQLTFGEFTPNTGAGHWDESNPLNPSSEFNRLGYGILNLGPMPLPGGRLAFTSNRNGFVPTKGFTNPTMQLYVMDVDGSNVEAIAPMTIGSALHPTVLNDGRLMFSSYEAQGIRDRRLWGIWTIEPDGRKWEPLVSAMTSPNAFHFMTQNSAGEVIVEQYYNLNNNGFGALFNLPLDVPQGQAKFGSPFPNLNPQIDQTVSQNIGVQPFQMPFTPWGYEALTPMTHPGDSAAPVGNNNVDRVGKFTQPSAAPDNDLLVVWTPGPANDLNRPTTIPYYDGGLYVINDSAQVWQPEDLLLLKNDPDYNEAWPRAVVTWQAIHGNPEPATRDWLPNDGTEHPALEAGTPYGLVGTSSLYKRDTFPGRGRAEFDGLDPFNTSQNRTSSNWDWQGADAGKYQDSDIWAIRILAMEPNTDRRYGPNAAHYGTATDYYNFANERLRIMGEIPVRKSNPDSSPVMDNDGNPDTSFLVKIPADTPFTFQTIDRKGMVLNMSQTWHQVRPGEMRADCGGCHAHSQQSLDFATTAANLPNYSIQDLSTVTPMVTLNESGENEVENVPQNMVDVEFFQDIRPVLQNHCISCHNDSQLAGQLDLSDLTLVEDLPGDYRRLAKDESAEFGHPPVIQNGVWRQTNASRYVRKFQSRRSLLVWKIFGERLDGWDNADHPTASVPGDANTLPNGANPDQADLDFIASTAHPAGGMTALSMAEKMAVARWIDLGAPIDLSVIRGNPGLGWFLDDLKPTLTISSPRLNDNPEPINQIILGIADANSGIDFSSLSITADFIVNGRPADTELSDLASQTSAGVYQINLDQALPADQTERHLRAEVADNQGNIKRVDVRFYTTNPDIIFSDGFD
ncbi:hypothetical protein [Marinicella litoralis]|uniref:Hydrazine synthase alpha subunit middle domain-containing protein n=1 Tax=Marinicella litoralis TaxID=644220 RepID=A0A4R6XRG3_9GAMM|nr:hypothetical protein [Marinicella litoralis]TDR20487.1 hypothetical protein C8D91_1461 [Marinicella litoralis]